MISRISKSFNDSSPICTTSFTSKSIYFNSFFDLFIFIFFRFFPVTCHRVGVVALAATFQHWVDTPCYTDREYYWSVLGWGCVTRMGVLENVEEPVKCHDIRRHQSPGNPALDAHPPHFHFTTSRQIHIFKNSNSKIRDRASVPTSLRS